MGQVHSYAAALLVSVLEISRRNSIEQQKINISTLSWCTQCADVTRVQGVPLCRVYCWNDISRQALSCQQHIFLMDSLSELLLMTSKVSSSWNIVYDAMRGLPIFVRQSIIHVLLFAVTVVSKCVICPRT